MRTRAAFVVGIGMVLVACGGGGGGTGGGGGSSTREEPGTDTNATTPGPDGENGATAAQNEVPAEPPSTLKLAPTCGTPGYRVVLTLGLTRDHRVPSCFQVDDARVEFAPSKPAKVNLMGPTSDGFCSLDVEIPKGAESGKVTVAIGKDTFESDAAFGIPCP